MRYKLTCGLESIVPRYLRGRSEARVCVDRRHTIGDIALADAKAISCLAFHSRQTLWVCIIKRMGGRSMDKIRSELSNAQHTQTPPLSSSPTANWNDRNDGPRHNFNGEPVIPHVFLPTDVRARGGICGADPAVDRTCVMSLSYRS